MAKMMSKSAMSKTINILHTHPSDEVYSVFQTEAEPTGETGTLGEPNTPHKLAPLGFFGRMLEGTGIVAFALAVVILTMTTGARAQTQSMLSSATGDYAAATMVAMIAVFAIMLAMLRRTWRQTSRTIDQAPRSDHRIR
jgi:hypothetical protein